MNDFVFGSTLSEKDQQSAIFLGDAHHDLVEAFLNQKALTKITQRIVADKAGVDKAAVSRMLSGAGNPTLRTLSDICFGMGLRPVISYEPLNKPTAKVGSAETYSTSISEDQVHLRPVLSAASR